MKVRRVVTGHSPTTKAVFASDEAVEAIEVDAFAGGEFHKLWGSDTVSTFPDDGSIPSMPNWFPPVGGFRFGMFTVPPEGFEPVSDATLEEMRSEVDEKLPGLLDVLESDDPGMHTTDTIDLEYVVSGRVVLELDDGETRELGPGDVVVQNGTRHAWRNPFSEPCRMVVVLMGAKRT